MIITDEFLELVEVEYINKSISTGLKSFGVMLRLKDKLEARLEGNYVTHKHQYWGGDFDEILVDEVIDSVDIRSIECFLDGSKAEIYPELTDTVNEFIREVIASKEDYKLEE